MVLVTKIFIAICAWIFLKIVLMTNFFITKGVAKNTISDETHFVAKCDK